jgi:glycerate 2-kinase
VTARLAGLRLPTKLAARLEQDAREIWWAGVRAVDPHVLVTRRIRLGQGCLHIDGLSFPVESIRRIVVVGAGKACAAMASAVERRLAPLVRRGIFLEGWVNVPAETAERMSLQWVRLWPARRGPTNEPTREGMEGAAHIERLVREAGPNDLVLCLLSGGGSALLPAPVDGVSLEEKQAVTALLSRAGATIEELNAVRKHLSRLKGGGLARWFRGRAMVSLILSDVIGDRLDVIASGPTAPDPTTFADAVQVLERYGLWDRVPDSVRAHFLRGLRGEVPETLKKPVPRVLHVIVGNNRTALQGAAKKARALGYGVLDLGSFIEGEAQQVARVLASLVRSVLREQKPAPPPLCILSGGETTVTVGAELGKGGRNQEFVVAALAALDAQTLRQTVVLAGGTDGEDGPTDAAGGVVSWRVWRRTQACGLTPVAFLQRHDTNTFLAQVGGLLRTGPTGTNVMDLRVALVASPRRR